MDVLKYDTYRSEGLGVNMTDNMVRATITVTSKEWAIINATLKPVESRESGRCDTQDCSYNIYPGWCRGKFDNCTRRSGGVK
jgi:hypothetical protein